MQELTPKFPTVIDSTIRNDFISCPRKWMYQRIYGLAPKGGSVHLVAGGAFAKGMEVARRCYYSEGMSESDAIVEAVIAAFAEYGDFEPEAKYETKSPERVAFAIAEYFAEYPMATDRVQPYFRANGEPAIEFEFTFPLDIEHPETGDPLLYGGRSDMVGTYMSGLWVVDEKTAGRLGPQWLKSFTLRGQFLGYCYAAHLHELPVNGFIVRGVSFLKDYYGHAEVPEPVPQHRIDAWRETLNEDVHRMVEAYNREVYTQAFGDACNSYGGCPFVRLCDKQDWTQWWNSSFEIDFWDPLGKHEVKPEQSILQQSFRS